ncbi:MAG TPA: serine/threonine-protein kinase [Pirellulales bacterium]|nr:serine/threonine-protein kinase [Pirellulales bacterium]
MIELPDPVNDDDPKRRIEAIAEEFLAGLQAGERPDPAASLVAHPDLGEPLKRRLTLVERLFRAGQNAKAGDAGPMPAERARRLKCPHCGNRIQLVEPRPKEITCVNCGSSFRVEPGTTATYRDTGPGGTVGRFEILELLGRGAFGEVYKAHDPQLDRFVALKVPRADYFATSEEEQRFLREARSAAGLRHPSIVQVYEIAHEHGSPYLISDYIDGLTLADLISGGRPAFRESAELVAQLADALDYAHRQKVVHRDIKPSNILLGTGGGRTGGVLSGGVVSGRAGAALDTHYSPFLADFGLARRDDGEIAVTLDGQVLGTPAYMSPEQAAGDHARVDGRSDVYSLGVVLYELLSGELPFRGSRRMLLHQVLNDEPRPPRMLNDQIPRDLETICLKAMAKEQARRYLTAADFRDDLRRFLRGDPIAARRVGRPERAWRWCRRNPAMATLAASLAVALVGGTLVASYFAVEANTRAVVARDAKIETERVLVRSLLVPLDSTSHGLEILSDPEAESLWELATLENSTVWLRFIDDGTRTSDGAARLCARSQPAMIAAVGLDREKRERASEILLERLRDGSLSLRQRAEVAFFALELVERPSPLADASVAAISESFELGVPPARSWLDPGTKEILTVDDEHGAFVEWNTALEPGVSAKIIMAAMQANERGRWDIQDLGTELGIVAGRMPADEAADVRNLAAPKLIAAIAEVGEESDNSMPYKVLCMFVGGMPPADAGRVLAEALGIAGDPHSQFGLAKGLAAAAAHMAPAKRQQLCRDSASGLVTAMRTTLDDYLHAFSAKGLGLVAAQMDPSEAERVCGDAARILLAEVENDEPNFAVAGLVAISQQMEPTDAAHVFNEAALVLIRRLENDSNKHSVVSSADGLASIMTGIDPAKGRELAQSVASVLKEALSREKGQTSVVSLAKAIAATAAWMEPADAERVCGEAAKLLVDATHDKTHPLSPFHYGIPGISYDYPAQELVLLAARMSPTDGARVCGEAARLLLDVMHERTDSNTCVTLARGLADLAVGMSPGDAAGIRDEAAHALTNALENRLKFHEHTADLVRALAQLASTMEPPERARVCRHAARVVVEALQQAANAKADDDEGISDAGATVASLGSSFASFADQLESDEAARLAAVVVGTHVEKQSRLARHARGKRWIDSGMLNSLSYCDATDAKRLAWILAPLALRDDGPIYGYGNREGRTLFDVLLAERCQGFPGDVALAPKTEETVMEESPAASRGGCRLTTPQLVELLKMPTCFGPSRRVILDHLEHRYGRKFNTVWAFVRFAEVEKLDLDFTTPPRRPDPAAMQIPAP